MLLPTALQAEGRCGTNGNLTAHIYPPSRTHSPEPTLELIA